MTRLLPRLAAVLAVSWMSAAGALGLGEIDVRSRLNQRFVAEIPLTAVSAGEAQDIKVGLASNSEFESAGLERPAYLSTLRFEVKTDGGPPRIEVRSNEPAREPFLMLLLDVRHGGSRVVREYTVFLDPPEYSPPRSLAETRPAPAPAPTPRAAQSEFYETAAESARRSQATPEPARQPPPAAQPQREPETTAPATADTDRYGPVQSAETLWSIATRLRPDPSVTMDQMLLALYNANPQAFAGGINGLLRNSMLRVPSSEEIRSVDPAAAREEVMRLRGLAPSRSTAQAPRATPRPAPISLPEPTSEPPAPTDLEPAEPETIESEIVEPESESELPPAAGVEPEPLPETMLEGGEAPEELIEEEAEPTPAPVQPRATPPAVRPKPAAPESSLLETLLLPLLVGLLVLGILAYLISRFLRRRAAGRTTKAPAPPRPAARPAAAPAAAVAAAAKPSAQQTLEELQETLDESDEAAASLAAEAGRTQQIETPAPRAAEDATAVQLPQAPAAEAEPVDFDLTGQFESQTVQIDLDANDPVSEADFHLAYGLYDEAALLLKQAAAQHPERKDIQIKLAETYFAAGKAAEFRDCAESIKPQLSAAEWQKIAIMGQQLCPDAALFRGESGEAMDAGGALDLDLGGAPEPQPAGGDSLDFKLDDLDLARNEESGLEMAPTDRGESLEFDLSQFDLGGAAASEPAPATAPEKPASGDSGETLDFDLDLGDFDAATPAAPEPAQAAESAPSLEPAQPEPAPASEPVIADIRLDDIDLGEASADAGRLAGDEAATKLDLARAYVDMGDTEMARSLLDEVLQQGDAQQKQDAQALIETLA